MKKLIAAIVVLLSVIVPVQAGAADQKALVIIDSYFDSRVASPNVSCLTLGQDTKVVFPAVQKVATCTNTVTVFPVDAANIVNHGDAMVEIAKKQNPNLKIIALRSSVSPTNDVNAGNFIDALNWVNSNSNTIGAVSFSRYFNGTTTCSPATTNTAQFKGVVVADKIIRDLIAGLKSKGIPVFVATGNTSGTKINYPACITDTNSVSVGALNSKGAIIPSFAYDNNTDYLGLYSVRYTVLNFTSFAQSTSTATAAIAAQWLTNGTIIDKVVTTKS